MTIYRTLGDMERQSEPPQPTAFAASDTVLASTSSFCITEFTKEVRLRAIEMCQRQGDTPLVNTRLVECWRGEPYEGGTKAWEISVVDDDEEQLR